LCFILVFHVASVFAKDVTVLENLIPDHPGLSRIVMSIILSHEGRSETSDVQLGEGLCKSASGINCSSVNSCQLQLRGKSRRRTL